MAKTPEHYGIFRTVSEDGEPIRAVAHSPADAVNYAANGWEEIQPFTSVNEPPAEPAKAADEPKAAGDKTADEPKSTTRK